VLARNLVSTQFWSVRCSTRSNPGGGTNERTGVLYDGIQRRTRTSISRSGATDDGGERRAA